MPNAEEQIGEEGPWEEEDGLNDEELFSGDEDQDQSQPPGSGPYATLSVEGAQTSAGAGGHPDSCMPCTFYCFTRRGCNRGVDCRFCHLTHQSKLQQRREAWKKQQREKRKSIRERVAAEALARRPIGPGMGGKGALEGGMGDATRGAMSNAGGCNTAAMVAKTIANYQLSSGERQMEMQGGDGGLGGSGFAYNPSRSILTIGQDVELRPQLSAVATQFRLKAPLPPGLILDPTSGVIHGAPSSPQNQTTAIIEADFLGGRTVRAMVELEVVDFTRGGFVIGHMSEFEPGKFMLLLYVPEEGDKRNGGIQGMAGNGAIKGMAGNGLGGWDPTCMQVGADADAAMNPQTRGARSGFRQERGQDSMASQGEWWGADNTTNRGGAQRGGGGPRQAFAKEPLARNNRPQGAPQVQAQAQPDWW